jgi:hypothetical protein
LRPGSGGKSSSSAHKGSWDRKGDAIAARPQRASVDSSATSSASQPVKDKDGFVMPNPQARTQRKSAGSVLPPAPAK